MRVLVVGGTGFIGPFVIRELTAAGHDVCLFHKGIPDRTLHPVPAHLPPEVGHIIGDRRYLAAFRSVFQRFAPDVVIDMIAVTEHDVRALLATFRGVARRAVVLSSMNVYRAYGRLHRTEPGPPDPVPLAEDAPLRDHLHPPGTVASLLYRKPDEYDRIPVERAAVGDPALPCTVLRLPMVYGPRDYLHRLSLEVKRMDDARPAIPLEESFARWRWTRGYVENVAHAIALAAVHDAAAGRVYNVGEPDALTYADWVHAVGHAAGWTGKVVVVPPEYWPAPWRFREDFGQHFVLDTTRIREELGFTELVPRNEGLERAVEWGRMHPPDYVDPRLFDYRTEDALLVMLKARKWTGW